jgi:hypothetical protein
MSEAADPYLPCPHCGAGNPLRTYRCNNCGLPMTITDATDPGPSLVAETRKAFDPAACEAEYQRINRAATADDGSDAHEPQGDVAPKPESHIDSVIDQLGKRLVPAPDRARLGRALDAADKPDTSRVWQDAAVARALNQRTT